MQRNKAFFEHLDYNTSQVIGGFPQSEQLRKMMKQDKRKGEGNTCKAIDEICQNGVETIREVLGEEAPEEGMSTMYIMTSKSRLHGTVSILRTDLLDTFDTFARFSILLMWLVFTSAIRL